MLIHNADCKEIYYPSSYEEVVNLIRKANEQKLTVHPFGLGTNHIGKQLFADVCISMSKLNKIIEISKSDLYVVAQAGVSVDMLEEAIKSEGLFLPFTYSGTLGGLASTNKPSIFSLLYPYPKDFILGAKIVTGNGEIIRSGSKTTKFSSGYKIWKVLSGALGSLGIYLELIFRLIPKPEMIAYAEVEDPFRYISLRPWGILSTVNSGKITNYLIFGGFANFIKKVSEEYSINFSEGLPKIGLECEKILGIITARGEEIEVLRLFQKGIAYVGAGYVRVCDPNALKLRDNGYTVIIEKGCQDDEKCFGFSYSTFKLIKSALDPNNILIAGLD
ncbi:FAD-binding oxidoreductase [Sulfurisphaera ohwakuensis]|uniref:FAD/FMN-containing dehydrogenase n=1 Tax=Sulfurisphaera ohwakuensis TaxID=69656 RepID=A0A7J9RUE8_SULOH|nr:FAD-binding oxidoreductase [Sulfurisphaera ohwakuensis]MBB5253862.1 FAD/FMN-containing dehydrogenase [Sulfurisphaera ohwakuensis]